jgi:hypothetical protein
VGPLYFKAIIDEIVGSLRYNVGNTMGINKNDLNFVSYFILFYSIFDTNESTTSNYFLVITAVS